jgi:Mg/Co/Ni transporter MgtE
MKYKNTKALLVSTVIVTITWLFISFIGWTVTDCTFRQCATSAPTILTLSFLGWIPIVAYLSDLETL